jgi:hypothetical protein
MTPCCPVAEFTESPLPSTQVNTPQGMEKHGVGLLVPGHTPTRHSRFIQRGRCDRRVNAQDRGAVALLDVAGRVEVHGGKQPVHHKAEEQHERRERVQHHRRCRLQTHPVILFFSYTAGTARQPVCYHGLVTMDSCCDSTLVTFANTGCDGLIRAPLRMMRGGELQAEHHRPLSASALRKATYIAGCVANRAIRLEGREWPLDEWATPALSRRTCSPRYRQQSC